jgi:hypothetical protein
VVGGSQLDSLGISHLVKAPQRGGSVIRRAGQEGRRLRAVYCMASLNGSAISKPGPEAVSRPVEGSSVSVASSASTRRLFECEFQTTTSAPFLTKLMGRGWRETAGRRVFPGIP